MGPGTAHADRGGEILGTGESGRIQLRAIMFGDTQSTRDPNRDVEIETAWCADFEAVRDVVARTGGHIKIERARPIGDTPVKIVPAKETRHQRSSAERQMARRKERYS